MQDAYPYNRAKHLGEMLRVKSEFLLSKDPLIAHLIIGRLELALKSTRATCPLKYCRLRSLEWALAGERTALDYSEATQLPFH